MSVDLGRPPAYRNGPSDLLWPSACVIGAPAQSSTLRAGITGQGVSPKPPWARPPKPGGLGWNWSLGKIAHFTGREALPCVIPHRGTKLGTLAQRWGMGGRVVEPITHTRTGSKTKGHNNFSDPLWMRMLEQYPIGMWG